MTTQNQLQVGLVSMPWMAYNMPSIQLATLEAALRAEGIASESHEFFLDYAACIGLNLYHTLSAGRGFIEEWIFAQHYFGPETGNDLAEFRAHRPRFGMKSAEMEDRVLDALIPITTDFLNRIAEQTDWSRYDLVGFSLTISQTAASLALARLIKRRYPEITIVCGGAACAGPMGPALLRICPYVDVVVGVEGEPVVPELVRRIRSRRTLDDLAGVSYRTASGGVIHNPGGPLYTRKEDQPHLRFDAYFKRLDALGLHDKVAVWLPFESSRGCWYGEKNQCTFCGLHEIMQYRRWTWDAVLAELEEWSGRYGVRKFFSVDLIMPRDYLQTFLPEITRRGHDWVMFYEVKANMKRSELEVLAAAGVRWIQPGLESLDGEVLKLMRKGVTPLQNIQLLKWCAELEIQVTWNIITGIPGESPAAYASMAERMQWLFHLMPPSGASRFALHRFSPYFEQPEAFGIQPLGAHPLYKYIFPVAPQDLDDLVYQYDYKLQQPSSDFIHERMVREAIEAWKAAHARGASLTLHILEDGAAEITDTRTLPAKTYYLNPSEALLYLFLDQATAEKGLSTAFREAHPVAAEELEQDRGSMALLEVWEKCGLVLRDSGRVLAIAVNASRMATAQHRFSNLRVPVSVV
jgi:ribosomal peptide maturation radical SAM protein 1